MVAPLIDSPSPASSVSSVDSAEVVNNNKRKRIEDGEGNVKIGMIIYFIILFCYREHNKEEI